MKILGYSYDVDWDALQLKQCSLNKEAVTKRQIASTLGFIFDPIGVFNAILMQSKIFIHSLCRAKVDWDQPLDEEFIKFWKSFYFYLFFFFFVILKKSVVRNFLGEHLIQIIPLNCVCLLMPLRRLMDVLFMLCKMQKDTCSFPKLKLVH